MDSSSSGKPLDTAASAHPHHKPQLGKAHQVYFQLSVFASSSSWMRSCFPVMLQRPSISCIRCSASEACHIVRNRTRIMHTLKQKNKHKQLHDAFRSLQEEGHKPSIHCYTVLLTSIIARKRFAEAEPILQRMEDDASQLDTIPYNTLINGFCEEGKMEDAMRIFKRMEDKGLLPTACTYNTLINGYGICGKPQEAMALLQIMLHSKDAKPNLRTYNTLLKIWCSNGSLEQASNVVKTMRSQGLSPDVVSFNTLAKAYIEQGKTLQAETLLKEMKKSKLCPNHHTFGIIINLLCQEGLLDKAAAQIQQMTEQGLQPNIVIFNTLLKGYANLLQPNGVDQVFNLMKQYGLTPDVHSFSIIMNAWSSAGMVDEAKATLQRMQDAQLKPDVMIYAILAKGLVRALKPAAAESLLMEMRSQGLVANVVMYTTIISGWCSAGRMDDAVRVYEMMLENNIVPNLRTFQTLIWGFSEAKMPWKAQQMLNKMKEKDILPDRNCLKLVAKAWRDVGAVEQATKVLSLQPEAAWSVTQDQYNYSDSLPNPEPFQSFYSLNMPAFQDAGPQTFLTPETQKSSRRFSTPFQIGTCYALQRGYFACGLGTSLQIRHTKLILMENKQMSKNVFCNHSYASSFYRRASLSDCQKALVILRCGDIRSFKIQKFPRKLDNAAMSGWQRSPQVATTVLYPRSIHVT